MKKYVPYAIVFVAGVMLAGRVRQLPGFKQLPAF